MIAQISNGISYVNITTVFTDTRPFTKFAEFTVWCFRHINTRIWLVVYHIDMNSYWLISLRRHIRIVVTKTVVRWPSRNHPNKYFLSCCGENMVRRYSNDSRWRVIYHQHILGSTIAETSTQLFVGTQFVKRVRKIYRQTGQVTERARQGPLRKLTCKYCVSARPS